MEIPLTQGKIALVDPDDYDRVMAEGKWHAANVSGRKWYAYHQMRLPDRRRRKISMHTFLTGFNLTDHINNDGLDNRRANLRAATQSQNMANMAVLSSNRSGYRGVSRAPNSLKWYASIKVEGHSKNLGWFGDIEEAALAYDEAAVKYFGEFARPNFPRTDPTEE